MSDVIKKYVKLGVLNYIEHETPRHYFLWDGIMEEEPGRVHSVVEELCDENIKLRKALDVYEREHDRFKHAKPEMTGAYFLAGGHGSKDDNQMPQFVEIVPAYGCGWSMIYEYTGRTISYEGS
jgi:hypothetical protein